MNALKVITDYTNETTRLVRADAVAVEFNWSGRAPAKEAIDSVPGCVLRAHTIQGQPILRTEGKQVVFNGDGNNADPIVCRPEELPELVAWLDAHFDNGSGEHWTVPNRYTGSKFWFKDYTQEEADALSQRARVWGTMNKHLDQEA